MKIPCQGKMNEMKKTREALEEVLAQAPFPIYEKNKKVKGGVGHKVWVKEMCKYLVEEGVIELDEPREWWVIRGYARQDLAFPSLKEAQECNETLVKAKGVLNYEIIHVREVIE